MRKYELDPDYQPEDHPYEVDENENQQEEDIVL